LNFARFQTADITPVETGGKIMDEIQRRAFMKGAAIGALAFSVGGTEVLLTPRQAQAQNVALRTLTPEQAVTLGAMGEALVPGAKDAGVVNFVDQQLSIPAEQALLEARIMNVRPPFANFYRAALGAVEGASKARHGGRGFAELNSAEQHEFIDAMRQNKIEEWKGPPGGFVYAVLRADSVDVVYGTQEGYAALGVPYMPHIAPTRSW
jgi:Gluconate 2-dehydrogenase subunit 3